MSLVRAVIGNQEVNVSPEYAASHGLTVLDEPTRRPDGRIRPASRRNGRPAKPQTSVASEAAKKKATEPDAEPTTTASKEK